MENGKINRVYSPATDDIEQNPAAAQKKVELLRLISSRGDRYGSELVKLMDETGISGTRNIPLWMIQKFCDEHYSKPDSESGQTM